MTARRSSGKDEGLMMKDEKAPGAGCYTFIILHINLIKQGIQIGAF